MITPYQDTAENKNRLFSKLTGHCHIRSKTGGTAENTEYPEKKTTLTEQI
jgi:hypothetical protein